MPIDSVQRKRQRLLAAPAVFGYDRLNTAPAAPDRRGPVTAR